MLGCTQPRRCPSSEPVVAVSKIMTLSKWMAGCERSSWLVCLNTSELVELGGLYFRTHELDSKYIFLSLLSMNIKQI